MRLVIIFAFLASFCPKMAAQAVIYGTLSDEKGQIKHAISFEDKAAKVFKMSEQDGTFAFRLPNGKYTLSYGGYRYLRDAIIIEVINNDSIRLDIQLKTTSKKNVNARIPKGKIPAELQNEWKIKRFQATGGKARRLKASAKMTLLLSQHETQEYGIISYSDACRGESFKQFFQLNSPEELTIYENYRPIAQTTELRPCDKKLAKRKNPLINALYQLQDGTTVQLEYINEKKMKLTWAGNTLLLKRG